MNKIKFYWKCLWKSLTLDDLPSHAPNMRALRENARILIIDDKEFINLDGLRNSNFNISFHDKWNDVQDVEAFSLIVSDNHGVVDSPHADGLTMINEARKMYPEKKYALYSANLFDIRDRNVEGLAIRTKGDELEKWIDMLEEMLKAYYNARELWKNIRNILDSHRFSEKETRELQHYFVLSVLKKECKVSNDGWRLDEETISLIIRIVGIAVKGAKLIYTMMP